jgi:hypothetical protein
MGGRNKGATMNAQKMIEIENALADTEYSLKCFVLNPVNAQGDTLFARVPYIAIADEALYNGEWFDVVEHEGLSIDIVKKGE